MLSRISVSASIFFIYPNPTSHNFTFSYDTKGINNLKATIFDKLGNVIDHIPMHRDIDKIKVNTSTYASGVYYIHIQMDNNKTIDYKKVVIIK
jgi:hypothetical protein